MYIDIISGLYSLIFLKDCGSSNNIKRLDKAFTHVLIRGIYGVFT